MEWVRSIPTEWAKDIPIGAGMPVEFVPLALASAAFVLVANIVLIAFGWSAGASSRLLSQLNAIVLTGLVARFFFPQFGGVFPEPQVAVAEDMGMWPPAEQAWNDAWVIPSITSGFFIGDFFVCMAFEELRDISTFVHHLAGIGAVAATAGTGFGVLCQAFAAHNELSTIFLNPHWAISYYLANPDEALPVVRPHLRTLRTLNGFFFWLTFTAARVVGNIYVSWLLYHASVAAWSTTQVGPIASCLGLGALHCLNSVWWVQLTKGLIKACLGSSKKPKKE